MAGPNAGLLVQDGLSHLARCVGEDQNSVYYIAWGTGTTAASAVDTKLEAEVGRLLATTIARSNKTLNLKATFTNDDADEADWSATEVGVFTSLTGGIMIYRGVIIVGCRRTWGFGETWEPTISLIGNNGSF